MNEDHGRSLCSPGPQHTVRVARLLIIVITTLSLAAARSDSAAIADEDGSGHSAAAVAALETHLAKPPAERGAMADQPFAEVALSRDDATAARKLLIRDHAERIRESRAAEMAEGRLQQGDLEMRFTLEVFGEKPEQGRSLVFSMHGGGGAPKAVNDSQWKNQKRLYTLEEGVRSMPRRATGWIARTRWRFRG